MRVSLLVAVFDALQRRSWFPPSYSGEGLEWGLFAKRRSTQPAPLPSPGVSGEGERESASGGGSRIEGSACAKAHPTKTALALPSALSKGERVLMHGRQLAFSDSATCRSPGVVVGSPSPVACTLSPSLIWLLMLRATRSPAAIPEATSTKLPMSRAIAMS